LPAPTPIDVAAIPLQVPIAPVPIAEPPLVLQPTETPREPRQRDQPELPRVSYPLPSDSGLEMIETRVRSAEPLAEIDAPRPKRTRPPRVVVADEPLQMVETRHDEGGTPPA
jgi:ribonuclease E